MKFRFFVANVILLDTRNIIVTLQYFEVTLWHTEKTNQKEKNK